MKELRCEDLGMKCSWVGKAGTDDELLRQAASHAEKAHGMKKIEEPMTSKVRAAIRTV